MRIQIEYITNVMNFNVNNNEQLFKTFNTIINIFNTNKLLDIYWSDNLCAYHKKIRTYHELFKVLTDLFDSGNWFDNDFKNELTIKNE